MHPDELHRLVKAALDSGTAKTLEEAVAMFASFRIGLVLDAEDASSCTHQSALLTAVALARRVFLGGAFVTGVPDVPLLVPLPLGRTLRDAVVALGGTPVDALEPDTPTISIGGPSRARRGSFDVRVTFAGWRGGVVPANVSVDRTAERAAMPLAPMLAAALAVNESFLHVRGEGAMAGRRSVGMSLWQPTFTRDWLAGAEQDPEMDLLPTRLWLIGLGHLGQAYLWALGLLPYPSPSDVHLVLQDFDVISPSSESTSVLSDREMRGTMKTRAMAAWCDRRGFRTRIHERLFDESFRRQEGEPSIALCGLDNALGRRALEAPGFRYVVEAGLGSGYQDFRTLRLHTLPGPRTAMQLWPAEPEVDAEAVERPAYQKMLSEGADRCGLTTLAGKAVGGPFVGAVAACLVISEILRLLCGGLQFEVVDVDLTDIGFSTAVTRSTPLGAFNPGFVSTRGR